MASIIQIGNKWRAQVRRKGSPPHTKTFQDQHQAQAWADSIEQSLAAKDADAMMVAIQQRPWADMHRGAPNVDGLPPEVAALPTMALDRCCGVYFLFLERRCVYVGQSTNVFSRIREHFFTKRFDAFAWMEVAPSRLSEVEQHYIKAIRPGLNVTHNRPSSGIRLAMTGHKPA